MAFSRYNGVSVQIKFVLLIDLWHVCIVVDINK